MIVLNLSGSFGRGNDGSYISNILINNQSSYRVVDGSNIVKYSLTITNVVTYTN